MPGQSFPRESTSSRSIEASIRSALTWSCAERLASHLKPYHQRRQVIIPKRSYKSARKQKYVHVFFLNEQATDLETSKFNPPDQKSALRRELKSKKLTIQD